MWDLKYSIKYSPHSTFTKTLYLASSGEGPLLGGGGSTKVTSAFQLATFVSGFQWKRILLGQPMIIYTLHAVDI